MNGDNYFNLNLSKEPPLEVKRFSDDFCKVQSLEVEFVKSRCLLSGFRRTKAGDKDSKSPNEPYCNIRSSKQDLISSAQSQKSQSRKQKIMTNITGLVTDKLRLTKRLNEAVDDLIKMGVRYRDKAKFIAEQIPRSVQEPSSVPSHCETVQPPSSIQDMASSQAYASAGRVLEKSLMPSQKRCVENQLQSIDEVVGQPKEENGAKSNLARRKFYHVRQQSNFRSNLLTKQDPVKSTQNLKSRMANLSAGVSNTSLDDESHRVSKQRRVSGQNTIEGSLSCENHLEVSAEQETKKLEERTENAKISEPVIVMRDSVDKYETGHQIGDYAKLKRKEAQKSRKDQWSTAQLGNAQNKSLESLPFLHQHKSSIQQSHSSLKSSTRLGFRPETKQVLQSADMHQLSLDSALRTYTQTTKIVESSKQKNKQAEMSNAKKVAKIALNYEKKRLEYYSRMQPILNSTERRGEEVGGAATSTSSLKRNSGSLDDLPGHHRSTKCSTVPFQPWEQNKMTLQTSFQVQANSAEHCQDRNEVEASSLGANNYQAQRQSLLQDIQERANSKSPIRVINDRFKAQDREACQQRPNAKVTDTRSGATASLPKSINQKKSTGTPVESAPVDQFSTVLKNYLSCQQQAELIQHLQRQNKVEGRQPSTDSCLAHPVPSSQFSRAQQRLLDKTKTEITDPIASQLPQRRLNNLSKLSINSFKSSGKAASGVRLLCPTRIFQNGQAQIENQLHSLKPVLSENRRHQNTTEVGIYVNKSLELPNGIASKKQVQGGRQNIEAHNPYIFSDQFSIQSGVANSEQARRIAQLKETYSQGRQVAYPQSAASNAKLQGANRTVSSKNISPEHARVRSLRTTARDSQQTQVLKRQESRVYQKISQAQHLDQSLQDKDVKTGQVSIKASICQADEPKTTQPMKQEQRPHMTAAGKKTLSFSKVKVGPILVPEGSSASVRDSSSVEGKRSEQSRNQKRRGRTEHMSLWNSKARVIAVAPIASEKCIKNSSRGDSQEGRRSSESAKRQIDERSDLENQSQRTKQTQSRHEARAKKLKQQELVQRMKKRKRQKATKVTDNGSEEVSCEVEEASEGGARDTRETQIKVEDDERPRPRRPSFLNDARGLQVLLKKQFGQEQPEASQQAMIQQPDAALQNFEALRRRFACGDSSAAKQTITSQSVVADASVEMSIEQQLQQSSIMAMHLQPSSEPANDYQSAALSYKSIFRAGVKPRHPSGVGSN